MQTNRRSFLKQVGGTSAGLGAASALVSRLVPPVAAQEIVVGGARLPRKSHVTSSCVLELEGLPCGWIWTAEGGGITADVMEVRPDPAGPSRKHPGPVKYEEIILSCGAGLNEPFHDWIKSFLAGKPVRKSGAVVYFDAAGSEVSRLNFTNAAISEIGFPAVDAKWEENAVMTVKLSPESTRRNRDRAGRVVNFDPASMPAWFTHHFRLSIDGLAETCARTSRIEAMFARNEPANGLEISDLVITFPPAAAQAVESWFEDFLIKGNHADAQEKAGKLEFLSPVQPEPFFTLSFEHLGIFRLEPIALDTGTRLVYPLQARMYCEKMRFDVGFAKA